jgi:hypothetical protein
MAPTPTRIRKTQIEGTPFDASSGHQHTGAVGDAPKIPISGLADVTVSSPSEGDALIYDDATQKWVAQPLPSGGLQSRESIQIETASLASGATDANQKFSIGRCCSIIRLQTNRAAWVRVYSKPAYQSADAARAQTVDPTGEHGVLLECITTADNLILDLAPAALVYSLDDTQTTQVNVTVKNLDEATGTVVVTLTSVRFEG